MTKSLCISWISACDYPLFRAWLDKYGEFFDEILIYWDVQFRHPFYWAFIQQSLSHLSNIKFLDPVEYQFGVGDWRNVATNELIKHATGDWICSIEQDFFALDWEKLLMMVEAEMFKGDLIGWMNPTNAPYIHPAFFFIKRELYERTSKDFSPHPEINGGDHFCQVTYDAQNLGVKIITQDDLGLNFNFSKDADAFHLGGINQNYLNGLTEGFQFHRVIPFYAYNYWSMKAPNQDPKFLELCKKIDEKLRVKIFSGGENELWEQELILKLEFGVNILNYDKTSLPSSSSKTFGLSCLALEHGAF